MKNTKAHSWLFRTVARVLIPAQILSLMPLPARAEEIDSRSGAQASSTPSQDRVTPEAPPWPTEPPPWDLGESVAAGAADPEWASQSRSPAPGAAKRKGPNRTPPALKPPSPFPVFSETPTDAEIFRARVFGEPLVPFGATAPEENRALAEAIAAYLAASSREETSAFERFLAERPDTAWRASLLMNLGIVYRRTGHFSRALATLENAWKLGKSATETRPKATADRALGELAALYARLGRVEALEALFAEIEGRPLGGSAAALIDQSRQGLAIMRDQPGIAFRCGPLAVGNILRVLKARQDPKILAAHSTRQGTSLAQMEELARGVGLDLRMAHREGDAEIPTPSLVHWKAGHFAALVKKAGASYLMQDPTFGEETWVSRTALNEEADGYFLVPGKKLPKGWRAVDSREGSEVWGKGAPNGQNPGQQGGCHQQSGGNAGSGGSGGGSCNSCSGGGSPPMAVYSFHSMLASLHIVDTPVGYAPLRGPAVNFQVSYNQREAFQPQTFYYSNLGPKWTFDWISYIEDDPQQPAAPASLYLRGGGQQVYTGFDAGTQSYAPYYEDRAVLVRTSASPVRYERKLPDGSLEVFEQPDGALAFPRRVFLTEVKDPQGNSIRYAYDDSLRLVAVTDAIGQVTTLSYDSALDPLRITKVTDPFGRSARFDYDDAGHLVKITDVIGLTSEFSYGDNDFITSLTTAYGTTRFSTGYGATGADRWVEATDPLGAKERLQYVNGHLGNVLPGMLLVIEDPAADPPTYDGLVTAAIPAGFETFNNHMDSGITFFWDKRAMALHPGDLPTAQMTNWMVNAAGQTISAPRVTKNPLENRVWYGYEGAVIGYHMGSSAQPIAVARVLDDGSTQKTQYAYNGAAKQIKVTDPLGRETVSIYGSNNVPDPNPATGTGLDLLQVKQKNGAGYDLIQSYTYNSQHKPLTVTDALDATTSYTYNAQGQLLTVTTPPPVGSTTGPTTAFVYDTNGYLQSVVGPVPDATTSFTYDAYGRQRTITDAAGDTRTFDYDALDRVVKVTHGDGTYEESSYNRLDLEGQRDRLGRWTRSFYDALRRLVATRDALAGTTSYQWCNCGSLDKLIDANGNAKSWERDLQGRVTREVRANAASATFSYEATTSRLKQTADRKGVTTSFEYFLDDLLKRKSYSDTTPPVTFTYDSVTGNMASAANGADTLSWAYDLRNRLVSEASAKNASTVSYAYDPAGNRTALNLDGAGFLSYAYDNASRLTGITRGPDVFGFGYDTASRRTSLSYPNGIVTSYGYDTASRLTTLGAKLGGTVITDFSYSSDATGNRTQKVTPEGTESYTYDAASQLTGVRRTGGTAQRWQYVYDGVGNRTTEQVDDAALGATYDNLNQLLSRQAGGALAFQGTLSEPATVEVQGKPAQVAPDGSFTGPAQVSPGPNTVTVTATDPSGNVRTNTYQVTASGDGASFSYDPNGNLVSKTEGGSTWTYEWNAENQLTRVTADGAEVARFAYDPLGRRVEKLAGGITFSFAYDAEDIVRARQSFPTGYESLYVHGPGIDEPLAAVATSNGYVAHYHADGLGSIVAFSSPTGQVTGTFSYDAFGSGNLSRGHAYTGREWDPETGLYYYRARYYDPKGGRFLSEDPIGLRGGINFYAYVRNNPVNRVDPLGLACAAPQPSPPPSPPPSTSPQPPPPTCDSCNDFLFWCYALAWAAGFTLIVTCDVVCISVLKNPVTCTTVCAAGGYSAQQSLALVCYQAYKKCRQNCK